MPRLHRIIAITFLQSISAVLAERAVYFAMHQRYGFSDTQNLLLAVCLAAPYIGGALLSHRLALRLGEKRLMRLVFLALADIHLLLIFFPQPAVIAVSMAVLGGVTGAVWPVIESYVSAGRDPAATSRAIGYFNVTWSGAVPIALALAGPLIALADWSIFTGFPLVGVFGAALLCDAACLVLIRPLTASPTHLALDHPSRVSPQTTERYRALLTSSRWSMLGSYALLFLASPLMPGIMSRLGVADTAAPALSGVIDWVRTGCFLLMQFTTFWHGRGSLIFAVVVGMPVGFFMLLLGPSVAMVVAGMVIFGVMGGLSYFSALYYGMVIKNASVDAGGVHEGLIGLGFLLGPLAGLAAHGLAAGPMAGVGNVVVLSTIAGVSPVIVVCAAGGLWPVMKGRKHRKPPLNSASRF